MDGNYRSLFITNRIVYVGSLNLSNIILYEIDMVFYPYWQKKRDYYSK